jgi:hypothetical protein
MTIYFDGEAIQFKKKFSVNNPTIYTPLYVSIIRGHLQRMNSKINLLYNW